MGARGHEFGGDWTAAKLRVIARYLTSYTTALQHKPNAGRPFIKAYIDAFAGTGYRSSVREDAIGTGSANDLLFPDLAASDAQALLDGSAAQALRVSPRFDKYVFIEQSADRAAELDRLRDDFPTVANDIAIVAGDANAEIQKICRKVDWRNRRAVLFLDPYGMQVEWKTLVAIAGTKAIDTWILFPLGIGVHRMLARSGEIPESWRKRLDLILGTTAWYDEFYRVEKNATLFGEEARIIKASTDVIGRYFVKRLAEIFEGVNEEPGVLRNSRQSPLYLLCFAVGTPGKGKEIALRIAKHLLKDLL